MAAKKTAKKKTKGPPACRQDVEWPRFFAAALEGLLASGNNRTWTWIPRQNYNEEGGYNAWIRWSREKTVDEAAYADLMVKARVKGPAKKTP
jgi:hypothetical protein